MGAQDLAGRFTPAASVMVAAMTLITPSKKPFSTISLSSAVKAAKRMQGLECALQNGLEPASARDTKAHRAGNASDHLLYSGCMRNLWLRLCVTLRLSGRQGALGSSRLTACMECKALCDGFLQGCVDRNGGQPL